MQAKNATLFLEAGNTLFAKNESVSQKKLEQARLLLDFYKQMNYDCFAIGNTDLNVSVNFLLQELNKRNILGVSSNIKVQKEPIFTPYQIFEFDQTKIAVTCLTSPNAMSSKKEDVTIEDPEKQLKKLIPVLQKQAEIIVLLSNLGEKEDINLAKGIEGIDVIIGSGRGRVLDQSLYIGGTYLLRPSAKGKTIGKAVLQLNDKGKLKGLENQLIVLAESLPEDKKSLKRITRLRNKYSSTQRPRKQGSTQNPFAEIMERRAMKQKTKEQKAKDTSSAAQEFIRALKGSQQK